MFDDSTEGLITEHVIQLNCLDVSSPFQALGQWGRSKKWVRDEWDLVKKTGEGTGRRACYQCF